MDKPITPSLPDFAQTMFSRPPETPKEPMDFLSRSWSISALELSKALKPPPPPPPSSQLHSKTISDGGGIKPANVAEEIEENSFCFASCETSQRVMERIMSQSQEVSPRTSGRLSHSSGPLNSGGPSCGGSLTDSPPESPCEIDDGKFYHYNNPINTQNRSCPSGAGTGGGGKTVGRWLKDRKEKKKEETRAHNAQLHAAVTVAGVAAAIAAIASATAASSGAGKDDLRAKTDTAVASAATLVAAQCFEAAEAVGAEREHLTAVVSSAVNVRSAGDIMTLTAGAATALRGAATLKARALKEAWNIAAVIPVDKAMGLGSGSGRGSGGGNRNAFNGGSNSGELVPEENFLGICNRELLAKGSELLKRTRKGDLHWKIVSVYINRMGQVILKMKSKHVAGTFTKKKKNVVYEVCKDMPSWPGRHLLEGGENRRYFGLKTQIRGLVEFECRNQREYDIWTQGVSKLLAIAAERNNKHSCTLALYRGVGIN